MKLLIIGAAGKTGMDVLDQARTRGIEVTALVHHYAPFPEGVRTIEGDAADPEVLDRALAGQDAVIDTIGNQVPYKESTLETNTAHAILAAMERNGVRRLLVVSALGVGDSRANTSFVYDHILMPTFLRGVVPDKAGMEREVSASPLDWTIVRPALLTDDEPVGITKLYDPADGDVAHKIARAELARFLLDELSAGLHIRKAVNVATV